MISTMPKSGEAPSSPNAMPGGLGAILQQPGGAPKGASSRSMQQMVDTARKMSDMQLADVLAGKSLDVPQYVAMTEAMGRKSLRTAMQGAQAQQAMRQPSVKDKLLAEEAAAQMPQQLAGIDQLAAPNMESVDMADGGIVAFANTGLVEDDQEARNPLAFLNPGDLYDKLKTYIKEKQAAVKETPLQAKIREAGEAHPSSAPAPTAEQTAAFMGNPAPSTGGVNFDPTAGGTYKPGAAPAAKKSGIAALTGAQSYDDAVKDNKESYLAKLAALPEKQREGIAQLRREGQGEALMNLAGALFSSPNMSMALSKGLPLFASSLASTRKEQRALEKEANDYDLNLARYQDALASGDKDRALQAQKMMLENQYHMAMVNKPGEMMQVLNAIRQPGESMADAFARYNTGKKSTVYDIGKAIDDYNSIVKDPFSAEAKRLKAAGVTNPYQYQQYVLNQGTMGGGTGSLQDKAAALLAEREKNKQKS